MASARHNNNENGQEVDADWPTGVPASDRRP
jgi:hypothetical protein